MKSSIEAILFAFQFLKRFIFNFKVLVKSIVCRDSKIEEFKKISLNDSLKYTNLIHACHTMIWFASQDTPYQRFALMQMRKDGKIGFFGGKCESKEITLYELEETLMRELNEEANYNGPRITIEDNYMFTHICPSKNIVLHFFVKKLTQSEFVKLESNYQLASCFPDETLGVFRVPLGGSGSFESHKKSERFLGDFIQQRFAGNAKQQFINSVLELNLVGKECREKLKMIS